MDIVRSTQNRTRTQNEYRVFNVLGYTRIDQLNIPPNFLMMGIRIIIFRHLVVANLRLSVRNYCTLTNSNSIIESYSEKEFIGFNTELLYHHFLTGMTLFIPSFYSTLILQLHKDNFCWAISKFSFCMFYI